MRLVSGIQPTGTVHLGNYFGALLNWVKLQNEGHDCFFFVANQHAITMPQNPEALRKSSLSIIAVLVAVGLDPQKSTLFIQSDVAEHAQLSWILTCLAPMGEMERMIQYKEKSESQPHHANAGLFTYPILQAADVLLYRAEGVPVGADQAQHLELVRELAKKFNNHYQHYFAEPQPLIVKTAKIIGLDGKAKMSKSLNNYIGLTDSDDENWNKLRHAATDPARVRREDPGNPDICNVYALHQLFGTEEDLAWVRKGCSTATIGCMDCKKRLFENMNKTINPIRDRYRELMDNPKKLQEIADAGAEKARAVAQKTLSEVYKIVGFK